MTIATILFSHLPIPYDKVGSWTTLYNDLVDNTNVFTHVVCPKTHQPVDEVVYFHAEASTGILSRLRGSSNKAARYANFVKQLKLIEKEHEKCVVHVVDNTGILEAILLHKQQECPNLIVTYAFHGFKPAISSNLLQLVNEYLDCMSFLTELSYRSFRASISEFLPQVDIIPNGVPQRFERSESDKENLHKDSSKVTCEFLWCSQDRRKKGLDILLTAWREFYKTNQSCRLTVVGARRKQEAGVSYKGLVPNTQVAEYFKSADCLLFTTLWQEGFGMVAAEAIHADCYVIASEVGGVPEVLQHGAFGQLVAVPNSHNHWIAAMNNFVINKEVKLMQTLQQEKPYPMSVWQEDIANMIDYNRYN